MTLRAARLNFEVRRYLVTRFALESRVVVEPLLLALAVRGLGNALLGRRAKAFSDLSQVHRTTRLRWLQRIVEPFVASNLDVTYSGGVRASDGNIVRAFGNRLAVLKSPALGGERGVLLVMFSEMLSLLYQRMDMQKLLRDYTLVFEPSWSGYCDEDLLRFSQFSDDIFVMAAQEDDHALLRRLATNLRPVDLGPCDWVDPRVAEPYLASTKDFDIVMNSNWGPWKRHHVLFPMLKHAKQRYRVALIGGSWGGRNRKDIDDLARYYGVTSQLTIFEHIPFHEVMDVTCRSRVSILLSLKEGSNRAISESIFCNVPVVVLANHIGGIVKNVVPETGLLVPERKLESAVARLQASPIQPRAWGLEHISCFRSTDRLNRELRERALQQGLPWTQDLATRASSPESKYVYPSDLDRLTKWNQGLAEYLRA